MSVTKAAGAECAVTVTLTLPSTLGLEAITHDREGEDRERCPGNPKSSQFVARLDPVVVSLSDKKRTQSEPEAEHPIRER